MTSASAHHRNASCHVFGNMYYPKNNDVCDIWLTIYLSQVTFNDIIQKRFTVMEFNIEFLSR